MKKIYFTVLLLVLMSSAFAVESFERSETTKDGYPLRIYQIDKARNSELPEFRVRLEADDEVFIFRFYEKDNAIEYFERLKTLEINTEEPDPRFNWRRIFHEIMRGSDGTDYLFIFPDDDEFRSLLRALSSFLK